MDKLIEKLITVEDLLRATEITNSGGNLHFQTCNWLIFIFVAMMYILAFLLTYRSFTTPEYLFNRLVE